MNKLSVLLTIYMILSIHLCQNLKYDGTKLYPNGVGKPNGYCRRELDLTILVDESSSIEQQEWEKLIIFLKSLIRSINIAPNYAHLSLVTFSTSIRWLISYLDSASKNEFEALSIVDSLSKSKPIVGFTYTGQALNFIRKAVLSFGARKNAPKAIILVTDGASTQPNVTSQAAALLRDEGVTMLVVGVKSARSYECKSIVGCQINKGDCPTFFMTNWDDIIRKVGDLMTEVCETIPQDAVCKPHWSDWSPCNVKCGQGTKFRKLMDITTIAEETVGTNGKSGKTCKEQFVDVEVPQEECTGPCNEPEFPEVPEPHEEPEPEEQPSVEEEPKPVEEEPKDLEETYPEHPDNHYDEEYYDEEAVLPTYEHEPPNKPIGNYTKHESTHESSHEEESTKKEEFKRSGATIAGGVVLALLMLGAGGGYAYYKRKPPTTDLEGGVDENFSEARMIPHSQEGETYTVADLDDGLWSESH